MEIIESPHFAKRLSEFLDDLECWELEEHVALHPLCGNLIPGGHGLRKLRWGVRSRGRGKRGGLRVIYYYVVGRAVFFVDVYAKTEQEDLSPLQLRLLVENLKEWPI